MRYSKSKGKNSPKGVDENASVSLQMELELIALKAKNADLVKCNTKLIQENAEMRSQIYTLQGDLLDAETKYNNVHSSMINLKQNMKNCTPNLISILNLFMDINSTQQPLKHFQNESKTSYTPSSPRAITQAVQPHTVNGTVLNLNPTIRLVRLSNSNLSNLNGSNSSDINTSSVPSTSNLPNDLSDNSEEEADNIEHGENMYVSSRVKRANTVQNSDNVNDTSAEDDLPSSSSDGQDILNKLSIIPEESFYLEAKQQSGISEIRICLSPLSRSDIENALNGSCSSTAANLNDTSINVEANLVEGTDNRASKRLKADMFFSPYTNSTRLEYDGSIYDQTLSVQVKRLPTPSASAMGDIDQNNASKLDILQGLPQNTTNISPITPIPSSKSMLNSRNSKQKSDYVKDQSPKSSRENFQRKRSENISKQILDSQEYKFPTVRLERLENILSDNKRKHDSNDRYSTEKPETKTQKDNENKSRKLKSGSRSKSPKKSIKRKHQEDETMENKLDEFKKRLSLCLPESDSSESTPSTEQRPRRAARPKNLKDASLKSKLRRLF